jgi:hypothetical protein
MPSTPIPSTFKNNKNLKFTNQTKLGIRNTEFFQNGAAYADLDNIKR